MHIQIERNVVLVVFFLCIVKNRIEGSGAEIRFKGEILIAANRGAGHGDCFIVQSGCSAVFVGSVHIGKSDDSRRFAGLFKFGHFCAVNFKAVCICIVGQAIAA